MIISAYCRVSTDSEQQEKSFEAQQSYFYREITAKGHQLFSVYGDEGETGTKLNNRKQFNQMLFDAGIDIIEEYRSDAPKNKLGNIDMRLKKQHINYEESERKPLFDEIWIKNTSRFARNTLSFQIVEKLRNKGVHIYFIEQNINTKELSADFLLKLFQLFDEQESRDKSSKVLFGMKERAKTKGTVSTTNNIYGYRYIKESNSLDIIENEAKVIQLIYKLYLSNYGIRRIINYLTENKIYTRNNKPFCPSSVKRILSNEKYCGTNVRNKYSYGRVFNKHSYAHINGASEWIVQSDHDRIPPIIDKAMFEEVQAKFSGNIHHEYQKGIYKGISEFAGLIYCESCGAVYHSNIDKGRRFYNCSTKRSGGTKACDNPNMSEKELKMLLTKENIYSHHNSDIVGFRVKLQELARLLTARLSQDDSIKVAYITAQLDIILDKKERYVDMYADSIISKDDMISKTAPLMKQIDELKYSIMIASKHNNELKSDISEIYESIDYINTEIDRISLEYAEDKGSYQASNFLDVIDRVIVESDGAVRIICKIEAKVSSIFDKYKELYNELRKAHIA